MAAPTEKQAKEEQKRGPKRPTALKRDIQNQKKNLRNSAFKSKVRTAIRKLSSSIEGKEDSSLIETRLGDVFKLMDRGAKKGLFKKNKAARTKSRLQKRAKLAQS